MNVKDLLGKKIIDKNARDLAKLAEIDINIKTFSIEKIYGSIGNPLSKKYYDIHANAILAVGDYIQVNETSENLEENLLDKLPDSEEKVIKVNNLIGKTVLDSEGNVAGKVTNVDIDLEKYEIVGIVISESSPSFGKPKNENIVNQNDITSIGDYIIINKVFSKEQEESEDSYKVDVE